MSVWTDHICAGHSTSAQVSPVQACIKV